MPAHSYDLNDFNEILYTVIYFFIIIFNDILKKL